MKICAVFLACLLSNFAHASGTTHVISTDTKEITVDASTPLDCEPGRSHGFPTPSALVISGLAKLFNGQTQLDTLVLDDPAGRFGNHCAELAQEFTAGLPVALQVTLETTETCIQDDSGRDNRAHYQTWQQLAGWASGRRWGGGSEVIAERYEPNSRCK